MIRRRAFIAGGLALLTSRVLAQPAGKVFRLGYLSLLSPDPGSAGGVFFLGLQLALTKLGYVVDRNIVFEERFARGQADKLPALAAELVQSNVEVILAGPAIAIRAALNATSRIPIVMAFSGDDPVKNGFVKSIARPGTNVTGVTAQVRDIAPKWVEKLRDVMPGIERIAILANPARVEHADYVTVLQDTRPAGVRLQTVEIREPRQYQEAFSAATKARAQALVILPDAIFTQDAGRLAALALSHRLPSIYLFREFPAAGGLMAYGPDHHEIFDLAAEYVVNILKGANPGELPVRQPMNFELVVNARTAAALGLTIPPSILAGAEVIR